MKDSDQGVTVEGRFFEWDFVYPTGTGHQVVYLKPDTDLLDRLSSPFETSITQFISGLGIDLWKDTGSSIEVIYNQYTDHYIMINIMEPERSSDGDYLYRNVVITRSDGLLLWAKITNNPEYPSKIQSFDILDSRRWHLQVYPNYIRLFSINESSVREHTRTLSDIATELQGLRGDIVDIWSVFFGHVTEEEIVKEHLGEEAEVDINPELVAEAKRALRTRYLDKLAVDLVGWTLLSRN